MGETEELARWIELHRRMGDARLRAHLQARGTAELHFTAPTKSSQKLAELLNARKGRLLVGGSPEYPARMWAALGHEAPPLLYAMGKLESLQLPAFAIIGTRRPSGYGKAAACSYAEECVKADWVVISGNAPGVDATAHEAALASGGATIVCPPVSLEQFTPSFNTHGRNENTLVLSPFVPGSEVEPYCFLRRNSLVAALCRGGLVAETGTRGGTLDTVKKLRGLDRPLWVAQLPESAAHANAHRMLLSGGGMPVPLEASAAQFQSMQAQMTNSAGRSARLTATQLQFGTAQ
jgi:DNA processing protein